VVDGLGEGAVSRDGETRDFAQREGVNADIGLTVLGKLLGHAQTATTQRYAHLSDNVAKQASNLIGERLAESLDGPPPRPAKGKPKRRLRSV